MAEAMGWQANAGSVSQSGGSSWLFARAFFAFAACMHFVRELAVKMKPLGEESANARSHGEIAIV